MASPLPTAAVPSFTTTQQTHAASGPSHDAAPCLTVMHIHELFRGGNLALKCRQAEKSTYLLYTVHVRLASVSVSLEVQSQ